jgi:hypothetical protein
MGRDYFGVHYVRPLRKTGAWGSHACSCKSCSTLLDARCSEVNVHLLGVATSCSHTKQPWPRKKVNVNRNILCSKLSLGILLLPLSGTHFGVSFPVSSRCGRKTVDQDPIRGPSSTSTTLSPAFYCILALVLFALAVTLFLPYNRRPENK